MDPLNHAEAILAGNPTPATLQWLRLGFEAYVKFSTPLSNALGFDEYPRGLPYAIRQKRRKELLFQALEIVDSQACSIRTTALRVAEDMNRLLTRARPRNDYERLLCAAQDANPSGSIDSAALWYVVNEFRNSQRF